MNTRAIRLAPLFLALAHSVAFAAAPDLDRELLALIRDYDAAKYATPAVDARKAALAALTERADTLVKQHPHRAEPLVWKGIALAERSGLERSLGMLKQARQTLEAALAVNPNPYATDAYTTLGSMYANAPGFPLSFGSQKKARELYEKALSINATGIGSNLNYAQFLLKAEDYAGALKHAAAVLAAPPRPGRERADQAARTSAERLIARAREKLRE